MLVYVYIWWSRSEAQLKLELHQRYNLGFSTMSCDPSGSGSARTTWLYLSPHHGEDIMWWWCSRRSDEMTKTCIIVLRWSLRQSLAFFHPPSYPRLQPNRTSMIKETSVTDESRESREESREGHRSSNPGVRRTPGDPEGVPADDSVWHLGSRSFCSRVALAQGVRTEG